MTKRSLLVVVGVLQALVIINYDQSQVLCSLVVIAESLDALLLLVGAVAADLSELFVVVTESLDALLLLVGAVAADLSELLVVAESLDALLLFVGAIALALSELKAMLAVAIALCKLLVTSASRLRAIEINKGSVLNSLPVEVTWELSIREVHWHGVVLAQVDSGGEDCNQSSCEEFHRFFGVVSFLIS